MKIVLVCVAVLTSFGCTCRRSVLPDLTIPHLITEEVKVKVAVQKPGDPAGQWSEECVTLEPLRWWLIPDSAVKGEK